MGKKNRSKKFLREEKSKVKLKKKLLPKGQNITDVSFKTKKIVIREQLKSKESGELLSHRKLNVKVIVNILFYLFVVIFLFISFNFVFCLFNYMSLFVYILVSFFRPFGKKYPIVLYCVYS